MNPQAHPDSHTDHLLRDALQALDAGVNGPDMALQALVEAAAAALDVPMAFVGLTDGVRLWVKASVGVPDASLLADWNLPQTTVLEGGRAWVPDMQTDSAWASHSWAIAPLGVRFMAASPLINGNGISVGVLCVISSQPRNPSERDARVLDKLAAVTMNQLELVSANRRQALQHQLLEQTHGWALESASQDPLTQVANRRALMAFLDKTQALANREKQPLSVLLLDVRQFKRINEAHGDAVGDQVLAEVASRLAECARGSELVGRMAGDEFMAVLYPCSQEQAKLAAVRYAAAVEGHAVVVVGGVGGFSLKLRVAVGICSMSESRAHTPEDLYRRAALALDLAKRPQTDGLS